MIVIILIKEYRKRMYKIFGEKAITSYVSNEQKMKKAQTLRALLSLTFNNLITNCLL